MALTRPLRVWPSPKTSPYLLRLSYMSSTFVEAILDWKYPVHLTVKDFMELFPMDWSMQEKIILQPELKRKRPSLIACKRKFEPNEFMGNPHAESVGR